MPVPTRSAVQRARALVDVNRWAEAAAALQPALADPQAGATPWCLLAQCQLALGQSEQALQSARRAVEAEPQEEWGHRLLAMSLSNTGRLRDAVRACTEALRLQPDSPHGLYLLSTLEIRRRHLRQAESAATHNIQANPHTALAWEGSCRVALVRRQWERAEYCARQGLRIDPQDTDLALFLGQALNRQGKVAEAGQTFAAAARSDPTDHRTRRALGRLGAPALGGLLALKFVPFLIFRGFVLIAGLGLGPAAATLGVLGGGSYGVSHYRYVRARRQLSPQLQAIADRERRQVMRNWLLGAAAVAGILALPAFLLEDPVTGTVLTLLAVGASALRTRLPRPPLPAFPPGNRLPGWQGRVQSIFIRLR